MQNPFRHREDEARRERDDRRYEAENRYRDETRSWSEGDGGRSADAWSSQGRDADRSMSGSRGWGYGQEQRSEYGRGMSTGYTGDRSYGQDRFSGDYASRDQGRRPSAYGTSSDYGVDYSHDHNRDYAQGGRGQGLYDEGSRGGRYGQSNYGSRSYGRASDDWRGGTTGSGSDYRAGAHAYPEHAYAPGSQIWEGSDRSMDQGRSSHSHHEFEPDYLHWRNEQMSTLDRDYTAWRDERRQKFASDFDSWRQSRPRDEMSAKTPHTPADNPHVGDVSDGGTGDLKKR